MSNRILGGWVNESLSFWITRFLTWKTTIFSELRHKVCDWQPLKAHNEWILVNMEKMEILVVTKFKIFCETKTSFKSM